MLRIGNPNWSLSPRRWQAECFDAIRQHLGGGADPTVVSAIMGAGKSVVISELCASTELADSEVIVVSTPTQFLTEQLYASIRDRCGMVRHVGAWYTKRKRLGNVIVTCLPSLGPLAEVLRSRGRTVALWIADELHRCECPTVLMAHPVLEPAHAIGFTATPFRALPTESIRLFSHCLYRYNVGDAVRDGVVVPWRIVHADSPGDLDKTCLSWIAEAEGPGLSNAVDIADATGFAAYLSDRGPRAAAIHCQRPSAANKRSIKALRCGSLRCLVHVNMLAEGADLPWLRWLVLRREVESRVRFIQEVGRALRAHPGKTEAVFYDPHDLFGGFKLSYAEALGEMGEKPEWDDAAEKPGLAAERIRHAAEPVALAWIESVVRSLVVAADAGGMLAGRKTLKKAERLRPSTTLQRVALRSTAERVRVEGLPPSGWESCLRAIGERPECLRFGFAADLIVALERILGAGWWPQVGAHQDVRGVELVGNEQLQFKAAVS